MIAEEKRWKRHDTLILLGLVAGSALLKGFLFLFDYVILRDTIYYLRQAECFLAGDTYGFVIRHNQHPLFAILVGIALKVLGDRVLAARIVSVSFSVAMVLPFYLLAREIIPRRAAVLAGLFLVLHPLLTQWGMAGITETTFLFFYISSVYFGWMAISRWKWYYFALSGISVALTYLVKPEGLAVLLPISLFVIFWKERSPGHFAKRLAALVCLVLAFFVFAFPYIWLLHHETGSWSITRKFNLRRMANPSRWAEARQKEDEIERANESPEKVEGEPSQARPPSIWPLVFHQVTKGGWTFLRHMTEAVHHLLFILAMVGLLYRRTLPRTSGEKYVLAIAGFYVLVVFAGILSYTEIERRHTLTVGLPLLFWAGVGFWELQLPMARILKAFRLRSLSKEKVVFIATLTVVLAVLAMKTLNPEGRERLGVKQAGLWLKENSEASSKILYTSRDTRMAFYSERKFMVIPEGNYQLLLEEVRRTGADYVVVEKKDIAKRCPDFFQAADGSDLKLVFSARSSSKDKAPTLFIYEVVGGN